MTHKCNFCDSILASEHSLLTHQKTAKKCLNKQGIAAPIGKFKCDMCKYTFLCKSILKKHTIYCNKKNSSKIKVDEENTLLKFKLLEFETKYNIILEERKKFETELLKIQNKYIILETKYNMIIEEKEKLLDKITTAALSKTNNTVKNNINITTYTRTDEELKSIYDNNLTPSHIEGGISAITKLIVDKVVTDSNGIKMITITDKARGTARYKLPSGEDVVDNGLNIFTTKNRNILMRRIYRMITDDRETSDHILDIDTIISKGYTEITDDSEGCSYTDVVGEPMSASEDNCIRILTWSTG
jgi:hypothetical protein